jgi:hypothetical protein
MCLLAASSVANDRLLMAHRTPAWQLRQGDLGYPGSLLSSVDDNAIKRITAGVRARRLVSLAKFDPATGLHPPAQISVERKKEHWHLRARSSPVYTGHWPVFSDISRDIHCQARSERVREPVFLFDAG